MSQAPPAAAGGRPADFERAEISREVAQLRVIELLIAKHQHRMAFDLLQYCIARGLLDAPAEIDAADFGDEVRIDLPNPNAHATSSVGRGENPPRHPRCQPLANSPRHPAWRKPRP